MKQYYHIEIRTVPYWHDDLKISVNNLKELKQYVKQHIQDCLRDYKPTKEFLKDNDVRKIYKRLKTSSMFIDDKNGNSHKIGKVFSIEYLPTENKMSETGDYGPQSYVSYWCHKLTMRDINHQALSEFEEVNQ